MSKVVELKAQVFDILVQQEQLAMQGQHLEKIKQELLKQLQEEVQKEQSPQASGE